MARMQRVLKGTVPIGEVKAVTMPVEAEIIDVKIQDYVTAEVSFWWLQSEDEMLEERFFVVLGTGLEFPASHQYRGTAMTPNGAFVGHLIELPKEDA
jgi:hypothetical protein